MPGDKYIYMNAGTLTEKVSNQTSAGAGDAGKIVALDSTGRISDTMLPVGIGADTASITASESLTAGDLVNVHNSSGPKVRKADASVAGKEAHGYVIEAVLSSGTALVYFEGPNPQVSGLTPGVQYLSATVPGGTTTTAPTGSGQVVQRVGIATSATNLNFESEVPVVLA